MPVETPAVAEQTLLLVERVPGSLAAVRRVHAGASLQLPLAEAGAAPDLVSRARVAMVFCDHDGSDAAGLAALQQILRLHPRLPIVLVLPDREFALAIEAFRNGAADVLVKPLVESDVARVLECGLARSREQADARSEREAATRSLDDLILLKAIGETASSEEDLPRLLDRVVDTIQGALRVEIVSLLLVDDDGLLAIRAARGLPADVHRDRVRIAPGQGVAGHVLAAGEAVLIEDLATDGRFAQRDAAGRYRTGSLLSVPIRYQERVVGVLNVNNRRDGRPFSGADQGLLQAIAHQAALAIENLKLVSRLRQQAQELERIHADLCKVHHDRTRFVCNLSHELKTPLTSVLGFADLLVNFHDQIDPDRVGEYLEGIYQEALHLEKLLSGMLRLFAIDSGSERWQWQELELISTLLDTLQTHELGQAEQGISLDYALPADLWPIWGDPDKVALLLDALYDNAIKFNRPGGSIRIRGENRLCAGRAMVYLSIANEGRSVPPESAEEIFQEYSQLGDLDAGKPSGVGIGLATCRAILRQMHGEIFLEPLAGEGTCLGVLLPTRTTYEELKHVHVRV